MPSFLVVSTEVREDRTPSPPLHACVCVYIYRNDSPFQRDLRVRTCSMTKTRPRFGSRSKRPLHNLSGLRSSSALRGSQVERSGGESPKTPSISKPYTCQDREGCLKLHAAGRPAWGKECRITPGWKAFLLLHSSIRPNPACRIGQAKI